MSERRPDDISQQVQPDAPQAENHSASDFSYSKSVAEERAQRAFGNGMDAAGMALSLRALEAEDAKAEHPDRENFIKKIIAERANYSKQDVASRILAERQQSRDDSPSR